MTVHIDKRGKRIEIRSSEPLPGMKTTVPGAYETAAGYWTVPLSLESCKLLRLKYGRRLKIGNELRRWAHGVVQSRQQMSSLAASENARLTNLRTAAPKLHKAMRRRKYQRVGTRFVADNAATLLADDPGLGKTLIAMGGILEAGTPGPYLVVAPKTAADSVWWREIGRWLPSDHRAVIMPQTRLQRERRLALTRYGPRTWLIVHPEMMQVQAWWECTAIEETKKRQRNRRTGEIRYKVIEKVCGKRTVDKGGHRVKLICKHVKTRRTKHIEMPSYPKLFEIEWGAIIIDESHESLIKRTGATTQRRRGLDKLKLRGDGLKIAMSGTPFDSKPHQLWGTLNWLDPDQYSAFHRWSELYWQKGGYTGFQIGEFRKDREAMLWDSLSSIALRRTKAEVAPDLPPKMEVGYPLSPADPDSPIGIWLEMDGKQAKAYQEMEQISITELESGRLEALSSLALLTRLKQLATAYGRIQHELKGDEVEYRYHPELPSNKLTWILESLEEWGFPKNPITKVVIVSFYTGILELFRQAMEKHFKTRPKHPMCTAITGRTPMNKRKQIIDRFNESDTETVMMLNVKAGGTAITLDSADRMIFVTETRIPDQQKQAEDRIHRVSNPRQCMYYYLRSLGTVDVGTALVNQEMIRDTHRLLDQRRGVDYTRHVLDLSHPLS